MNHKNIVGIILGIILAICLILLCRSNNPAEGFKLLYNGSKWSYQWPDGHNACIIGYDTRFQAIRATKRASITLENTRSHLAYQKEHPWIVVR